MHARNRRTGAPITGTLQRLYARAKLLEDGFGRAEDGRITHEHEGGTDFFYDTSETVRTDGERTYVDDDGEQVAESDVELYEPGTAATKPPERPRAASAAGTASANALNDPDAAARGVAERFIASMVAEVDDYHEALAAARESERTGSEEEAEKAVSEARDAFVRNAGAGIQGIDVASRLVDLATARDALAPIIRHVDAAIIRVDGPNAIEIRCLRDSERFRVDEISAHEYGRVIRMKPDRASAAHADVYANAILDAWGATRH